MSILCVTHITHLKHLTPILQPHFLTHPPIKKIVINVRIDYILRAAELDNLRLIINIYDKI